MGGVSDDVGKHCDIRRLAGLDKKNESKAQRSVSQITLPPINMEPNRGSPPKMRMVFQDPLSGSIFIGGRIPSEILKKLV